MSEMIEITLPDGKKMQMEKGSTVLQAAHKISHGLANAVVAASVDGKLVDLTRTLETDCSLKLFKPETKEGLEILRHSASHVMAQAVLRVFPDAKLTIGPVVEEGFYYDIEKASPFTPEDIPKIEDEMRRIVEEDQKFERVELPAEEVLNLYLENQFKQEIVQELMEKGEAVISVYYNRKSGKSPKDAKEFFDMCTGPHVPSTGWVKAIKILKIAGAYWRGDSEKPQLQRIYGIAFPEKKQLEEYVKRIEEAEKRDHRKIGKELELMMISDMAPGMPFFLPNGFIIRQELENFIREEQDKRGYLEVRTPVIMNEKLWHLSGHWDHYKDNMYFTKIDEQDYGLKPMNCPGHMLIFKNRSRSYRELPIRISEMGHVHRHELSGVLSGMFRVRSFVQDDSHIFVSEELIEQEVLQVIGLVEVLFKTFDFEYFAELSTRPENFMGEKETWDKAEQALKLSLDKKGMKYQINEGDGAFYGPKIDFKVKDAIGRVWQLSTIQLDFQMPRRFELEYEGSDGKRHTPIVIHRAILGSFERFFGVLIEHYAGKFPVWLCPVQVAVLPISDEFLEFGKELGERIKAEGIRVAVNDKQETMNSKIRDAQMQKIPYMLVVGNKEKESGNLMVRERNGKQYSQSVEEFIQAVKKTIKEKKNIA